MFTKPSCLRLPCLRAAAAAVVVRDSMHLQAVPPVMLIVKKETVGFHNIYALFSSVSPISVGMGLGSLALCASKAPLNKYLTVKLDVLLMQPCKTFLQNLAKLLPQHWYFD